MTAFGQTLVEASKSANFSYTMPPLTAMIFSIALTTIIPERNEKKFFNAFTAAQYKTIETNEF